VPATRSSPTRSRRLLAVLVLGAALAACAQVSGTAKTVQALNRLDIEQPTLKVDATNTGTSVKVSYRSKQEDVAAYRSEVERVQEIVWTQLPFRFDALDVQAEAPRLQAAELDTSVRATRAQLRAAFGPRPAGLGQSARRSVLLVLGVVGLVVLLLVALVILVVLLVVRRRRATSPPAQDAAGWGSPPPGQGP
jgi:hypothetical protein